MRKIPGILFLIVSATVSFQTLVAQNRFFTDAGENTVFATTGRKAINPEKYRAAKLNVPAMKAFLWSLPAEKTLADRKLAPVLELPMPGGGTARYRVWESSIMEPGLEAKFPEIKTFLGQGIDDPSSTIRFDYNPYFGFSAQVLSPSGNIYIDPFAKGDINNYMSYFSKDNKRITDFVCNVPSDIPTNSAQRPDNIEAGPCRGTLLASYRLAVACTGEYAVAVCAPSAPTVPATLAAMVTSVNRVDGVYESELAVRLILVANDNLLINLSGATDPYTNTNPGGIMLSQNQTNVDAVIGTANYDVGHVFSTGGGGIAGVGVICIASQKAHGVTGTSNPVGDAYDIDYVAHELGHQFGGLHSFNGITSNCGAQISPPAAYEVGSGTTIMCYAGICGVDNTQTHSDPFFHTFSFDQIGALVQNGTGASCKVTSATGNNPPQIITMDNNGVSIPISTPFTLTGSAFDPDGDPITYCWEEFDLGPSTLWNGGNANTTSPLFKSRIPKTVGSRTFPDINVILAGFPVNPPATMGGLKGETLPTTARTMKFRLTIRDNKAGGGGVVTGGSGCQTGFTNVFQINTVATPGPFAVTVPNGGESYAGGTSQTVTWNVVTTDQAPISCANVKISLSTDGGQTFPTVLLASTPNDGTAAVTIPGVLSSTARIKVEAVGNIFFDISNQNFSITAPVSAFDFDSPASANLSCPAIAASSITLGSTLTGGFSTPINLSASNVPSGANVIFGTNPLTPGNSTTVTLNNANTLSSGTYTITVTGIAGAITRTRDLSFIIPTGTGPTINTQPLSHSACVGSNTSFTVAATGATAYQWQLSTDGTNYNNIGGATSATYSITGVQITDNGSYRVNVTGQCGSTMSTAATLTVQTAPSISVQPQSATLCVGSNNTFSVTAAGSSLTYQWQLSTDGGTIYNNIGGATNSTYLLSGITAGLNNNRYRVIVSGACTPSATSTGAILTVVTSVGITTQPANVIACVGSDATFNVVGSGTGVIYQWQLSTDGGTNFNNIAGATNQSYTALAVTQAMNGYQYRVQLSNATCVTPGVSNAAILTVNTLPAISTQPQSATICENGDATFSVSGTGTALTYQWQVSTTAVPAFTNIGGATLAELDITNASATLTGNQYRVIVSGACAPPVTSTAATLTVIIPAAITVQPADKAACQNTTISINVTTTSSQPAIYQWQVSSDGGANFTDISNGSVYSGAGSASLSIAGVPLEFDGNQYRVLVSNGTCTSPATSSTMTLTVHQVPIATLAASPTTSLAPGQTTTLTLTPSASTGGVISYVWSLDGTILPFINLTNVVGVEDVGAYQVAITETWPGDLQCTTSSQVLSISAPASDKLFIFPNPNDGLFTVSYYNASTGNTTRTVSVFDSHGSRVHQEKFTISGPYTLLHLNIKPSGSGIYVVSIRDANGKKLVSGKVFIKP